MPLPPPTRLLDPGPTQTAQNAAHIPFTELPQRTQELPPKPEEIQIANTGPEAEQALIWLKEHGRQATLTNDYEPGQQKARLWRPTPFLEATEANLRKGKALDLACGTGRDAIYLAGQGHQVTAIDHLQDALDRGQALATHYLDQERIGWQRADIEQETWNPPAQYDLITIFRYLHRPLLPRLHQFLTPTGHLILETFTTKNLERHEKPSNPRYLLQPNELPTLLEGLEILAYEEAWHDNVHTAQLLAKLRSPSLPGRG